MIKYTWFKRTLAKATPIERDIATKHFNHLWDKYHMSTQACRELYQARQITLTAYRNATKDRFRALRLELQGTLAVVVSNGKRR